MTGNVKIGQAQVWKCLLLIGRFEWLRLQEIALFIWKNHLIKNLAFPHYEDKNRYFYAQALVKKMVDQDLVLTQKLPDHAGTAVVLTEKGAKILREMGYKQVKGAKLITDDKGDDHWTPNPKWKHDLMVNGFTALAFVDMDFLGVSLNDLILGIPTINEPEFLTEKEQIQIPAEYNNPILDTSSDDVKYTDLLIEHKHHGMLGIEFEKSRKSGEKRDPLIKSIVQTNKKNGRSLHSFNGLEPGIIAIAYDPEEKEKTASGSYKKINHFSNIYNATIKKMHADGLKEMKFMFFELKVKNFGVIGYEINTFDYSPNYDPTL